MSSKYFPLLYLLPILLLTPVVFVYGDEDILQNNLSTSNIVSTEKISSEISPKEDASSPEDAEYFATIGEEVVPIETNTFSSRKALLRKNFSSDYYPEIENIDICPKTIPGKNIACLLTTTIPQGLNIKKITIFQIDKTKLKDYLTALNKTSQKKPSNVQLKADENGNIIITKKEQYGSTLDIDKILNNALEYFGDLPTKKNIVLPIKKISPTLTSDNYQTMGIKKRIGHGESNFRGSPKNRIHNIHVATSKFEGVVVPPGETFSFIKNLGEVNGDTGYKEELVIKNHKTIPEFGGGVCQVSTTLFRAAVNTGLKITERRNHAYPVQYYSPQGTDATVYIPKPDLQFINDTPGYILIQPYFNGTILSFDIFGTSDGRQVETEGPTLLKRTPDGGRKYVWWQIIKDKDGNQIAKNGFWSFYHNAAAYHHSQEQILTSKPKNWSGKEWKKYKREHGM